MKKKILAITGIRSEYDILYPVIDILRKDSNFEVKVVACGAHLTDWHGVTLKQIEKDGFRIADKINYLLMTGRKTQRPEGVGILTQALSKTVEREKPDFILVVGDREESIAAAIVGNYMNVLVVHIGGGDPVYGNADDPMRFAVSKLAHLHFTFAKEYAENLLKTGEERFRVFCAGNPALERIKNTPYIPIKRISKIINFDVSNKRFLILIKHPLSSEKEGVYSQMKVTLDSLLEFCEAEKIKVIGIYPNTDPGALDILKVIKEFDKFKSIKFFKTLPQEIFVNLLRNALALAGNSSMGILEAPFYNLPVVNIGNRQKGRLNAGNVEFVNYDKKSIKKALLRACFDKRYRDYVKKLKNPYGDTYASRRIKNKLSSIDTNEKKWYVKKNLFLKRK